MVVTHFGEVSSAPILNCRPLNLKRYILNLKCGSCAGRRGPLRSSWIRALLLLPEPHVWKRVVKNMVHFGGTLNIISRVILGTLRQLKGTMVLDAS